jgi:hypothetical protein
MDFPNLIEFNPVSITGHTDKLLILSEGFEDRSLSLVKKINKGQTLKEVIICRYSPKKESKYDDLIKVLNSLDIGKRKEIEYNRFDPYDFESNLRIVFLKDSFDEVIVDISVMSKYMIMQILYLLKECGNKRIKIIYTEPESYAPTSYDPKMDEQQKLSLQLPSTGVGNIVRTPLLSSVIMQKSPSLLIAFLSFNEQLIRALLTECNPAKVILINGVPPRLQWREKATNDIYRSVIHEYKLDNPVDNDDMLLRKCSTLFYQETIIELSEIYKKYGEDYRLIVSPTGSKMQAVGCALMRICCEDIHIEYPTPESYYVLGYSSSKIKCIHQLTIDDISKLIKEIGENYSLNG